MLYFCSINTLGAVLLNDKKLADAEEYVVQAMQLREATLGCDHPSTIVR